MKNYKRNLYKLPLNLYTRRVDITKDLELLLDIEKQCYEEKLLVPLEEIKEFFDDEEAFGLILYQDGKAIGYFSGTFADTQDEDPELQLEQILKKDEDICHIYNISILKKFRSVITFDYLICEIALNVKALEYAYLTSCSRVKTGLARTFRQRYGGKILKRYDDWEGYGEPFDFLLFNVNAFPTLPAMVNRFFNGLRKVRRQLLKYKLIKPKLTAN